MGPIASDQTGPSDAALMTMVAAADTAALGVLYDRYGSAAFGLALRIIRDPFLAEDAVHDAFLGVWRTARRYDPSRGGVRTWVLAIVHHRSIDLLRRRRAVSELPTDGPVPATLVQPDFWPEIAGGLDRDALDRALQTLGSVQREAIEMAFFSGLTHVEIARETGAPLGTVKSRIRLGLLVLRSAIGSDTSTRPASSHI